MLLLILLSCSQQDTFNATDYYEQQYKDQCAKALAQIQKIKSNPRTNNVLNIQSSTERYNDIKVNLNFDLPRFNFNEGVQPGDIATFGKEESRYTKGGVMQGAGITGKVTSVSGNTATMSVSRFGTSKITGLRKAELIDEKVVMLSNYVLRYDGKEGSVKSYTVLATPAQFYEWKKSKFKKK